MGKWGFLLSNFAVSFVADIILNDLSSDKANYIERLKTLKPYFKDRLISVSGLYASITVITVVLAVSFITRYLFNFYYPKNNNQLIVYLLVCFVMGYIADIAIDKLKLFGDTLDEYYKEFGSGLWGALALQFSVIVSYVINNYLIPLL